MTLTLESSAFLEGDSIPRKYTCDGEGISPPLKWMDVPEEAESLVLIMDDPDAPMGTWDHWILYNIPTHVSSLEEGVLNLPRGTCTGVNSFGDEEYGGPCPPDYMHRYSIRLYALDTMLDLHNHADRDELERSMRGHVLAKTELMGKYERLGE